MPSRAERPPRGRMVEILPARERATRRTVLGPVVTGFTPSLLPLVVATCAGFGLAGALGGLLPWWSVLIAAAAGVPMTWGVLAASVMGSRNSLWWVLRDERGLAAVKVRQARGRVFVESLTARPRGVGLGRDLMQTLCDNTTGEVHGSCRRGRNEGTYRAWGAELGRGLLFRPVTFRAGATAAGGSHEERVSRP